VISIAPAVPPQASAESSKQDKTYSTELWLELNNFKYEITDNIYSKTTEK